MTQDDVNLIQQFHAALQQECNKRGVPVRQAGTHEERCPRTGDVYLVSFFFQVFMLQYELYVNVNLEDKERRYGWRPRQMM